MPGFSLPGFSVSNSCPYAFKVNTFAWAISHSLKFSMINSPSIIIVLLLIILALMSIVIIKVI